MTILFTEDELRELTGYAKPACQLRELHQQGFWRARRQPISGRVALERAHYEAVCEGCAPAGRKKAVPEPKLTSEAA